MTLPFPVPLRRGQHLCAVCDGYGTVPRSTVLNRAPVCTCGAGAYDELTLHDVHCDTVPCPFCQLASAVPRGG